MGSNFQILPRLSFMGVIKQTVDLIFAEFVVWKIGREFYFSHRALNFCTAFIAYDERSTDHSRIAYSLHISPKAMHTHVFPPQKSETFCVVRYNMQSYLPCLKFALL
jgi:hypothetical protein